MGFAEFPGIHRIIFELKELHREIGQLLVQEPTESDIAEGYTKTQVWFVDAKNTMWLLFEEDCMAEKDHLDFLDADWKDDSP